MTRNTEQDLQLDTPPGRRTLHPETAKGVCKGREKSAAHSPECPDLPGARMPPECVSTPVPQPSPLAWQIENPFLSEEESGFSADYRRTAWISIISPQQTLCNNLTTGIHHEINARIRLRSPI